jgi:hypothetical protein
LFNVLFSLLIRFLFFKNIAIQRLIILGVYIVEPLLLSHIKRKEKYIGFVLSVDNESLKKYTAGTELFHADGQTDMLRLNSPFRNFGNAPKKSDEDRICLTFFFSLLIRFLFLKTLQFGD